MYKLSFYSRNGGVFENFFKRRSFLIKELEAGRLTKKQFLENNYNLVRRATMKPFLRIDSYEMGMYNYQYYNVLAKYYKMLAKDAKEAGRPDRYYREYLNKGNNYYNEKDKATLSIIEFLDFENMEAYYIDVNSKSLNGKLFEIVLLNHEEAIFHSKSEKLLRILKEKNTFTNEMKKSIIDNYINETY